MRVIPSSAKGHRRDARAELKRYRRRVDAILASITDAFFALDDDLRLVYLNDRAVRLIGELGGAQSTREELLGQEVLKLVPQLGILAAADPFREVLRERRTVAFELPSDDRCFDLRVFPSEDGLAVYLLDVSARKAAERAGERQARQQAAVAQLGLRASRGVDLGRLMDDASTVVARTLEVELVAVAERSADGERLLLRAGTGWDPGCVGVAESASGPASLVGYTVQTREPFVSEDVAADERCSRSPLLIDHGVRSAAVVVIPGPESVFGALGVFSRERRVFAAEEVDVLRAVANVLHGAVERAQMRRRVREAREGERRRIARALHDETLQELGAALARAARGTTGTGRPDEQLVRTLQRAGEQIRAAVYDLRLADSADRSFATQLEELVDLHRSAACHGIELVADGLPDRLPAGVGPDVLRIVGEALTNARRHANASQVVVDLSVADDQLVVIVADDGRGLERTTSAAPLGGFGLVGMCERAELLGGTVRIAPVQRGGTAMTLRVPLQGPPATADRVRVLLVDDHAAIREAMALACAADDGFVVTGQAGSLAEARGLLAEVDVAIVDLGLPDGDGADLIADLAAASPDAQVLVLSANVDRAVVARAVEKGAAGVLDKATQLHEVVAAVRRLRAGDALIAPPEIVDLLRLAGRERERDVVQRQRVDSLTPRERQVLRLMADGLDNQQVAARLHISPRTQRNHVANILAKLGVHTQLQALVFALRHGVVEVPRGAD